MMETKIPVQGKTETLPQNLSRLPFDAPYSIIYEKILNRKTNCRILRNLEITQWKSRISWAQVLGASCLSGILLFEKISTSYVLKGSTESGGNPLTRLPRGRLVEILSQPSFFSRVESLFSVSLTLFISYYSICREDLYGIIIERGKDLMESAFEEEKKERSFLKQIKGSPNVLKLSNLPSCASLAV